jgi:spoIIIJ-associated protein
MSAELYARVEVFVREVCTAMGMTVETSVEETGDSVKVKIAGATGEALLRRQGEGLDALQHIVNTAFKRELRTGHRLVVDYLDFRTNRDEELRQIARILMDKAKETGEAQEIGPLNPYARRLVHLAVAADPDMASESSGDAFLKTISISRRRP